MKEHKLANIIPPMSEEEYQELKEDIRANGLEVPIVLYEGKVLEGRHRYRACQELGIKPRFKNYEGTQPLTYVISLNLKRRHLTASQKATIAVEVLPILEEEARKRQATGGMGIYGGKPLSAKMHQGVVVGKSAVYTSKTVGVGERYIYDAKKIKREDPKAFEEIRQGKKTINEVKKEQERKKRKERIIALKNKEVILPKGKYHCLVVDPPWPMSFIDREVRPRQVGLPYPIMTIEEIKNLPISDLAYKDCHLYLWTTHKYLPFCFEIVKTWGFKYQCLMTWVKNVGFTPFSWMYSTEHILFCTKGNLPLLKKGVRLDFRAKVRQHSRKPSEFYEIVKQVSPEPRIDLFSRERRGGFDQWGNEIGRFGK